MYEDHIEKGQKRSGNEEQFFFFMQMINDLKMDFNDSVFKYCKDINLEITNFYTFTKQFHP